MTENETETKNGITHREQAQAYCGKALRSISMMDELDDFVEENVEFFLCNDDAEAGMVLRALQEIPVVYEPEDANELAAYNAREWLDEARSEIIKMDPEYGKGW